MAGNEFTSSQVKLMEVKAWKTSECDMQRKDQVGPKLPETREGKTRGRLSPLFADTCRISAEAATRGCME